MVVGQGDGNCILAIFLLPQVAAVLMCHAHRMVPLLGEGRIVHDPSFQRVLGGDQGQAVGSDSIQENLMVPDGICDEALDRRIASLDVLGVKSGGDGFHALPLSREQESKAIVAKRFH